MIRTLMTVSEYIVRIMLPVGMDLIHFTVFVLKVLQVNIASIELQVYSLYVTMIKQPYTLCGINEHNN